METYLPENVVKSVKKALALQKTQQKLETSKILGFFMAEIKLKTRSSFQLILGPYLVPGYRLIQENTDFSRDKYPLLISA